MHSNRIQGLDRLNWTRHQKLMRSLYFRLQAWNSVKTVEKLDVKTVPMGLVEAQRWCKPQELPFDVPRYGVGMRMTGENNVGVQWVDLARLSSRVGVEPAALAERPPIQKGISRPKYLDRKLPMAWSSSDTSEFELEIWDCRMQMFPSFEKKKVEEMIRGFVWFCPPSRVPPSERPNFLKGSLHSLHHSSRSTMRFPVEIGTGRTPQIQQRTAHQSQWQSDWIEWSSWWKGHSRLPTVKSLWGRCGEWSPETNWKLITSGSLARLGKN